MDLEEGTIMDSTREFFGDGTALFPDGGGG